MTEQREAFVDAIDNRQPTMPYVGRIGHVKQWPARSSATNWLIDIARRFALYVLQTVGTYSGTSSQVDPADRLTHSFDRKLPRGWYMLELCVAHQVVRTRAAISISEDEGSHRSHLSLSVFSGRMCKRLVYLPCAARVSLTLSDPKVEIQHLKLVLVTRKFAHSRILQRLRSGHPRYMRGAEAVQRAASDDAVSSRNLNVLWADYCRLFDDEERELFNYGDWVQRFDTLSTVELHALRADADRLSPKPMISVLLDRGERRAQEINRTVNAIVCQAYQEWELLVDGDSLHAEDKNQLLDRGDQRIRVLNVPIGVSVSERRRATLSLANGDWVAFVDCGDVISADALLRVASNIAQHTSVRAIYSDEDSLDDKGIRFNPHFKGDWDRYLFYTKNYLSNLFCCAITLAREVSTNACDDPEFWRYDLIVRCIELIQPDQIRHIHRVLYHKNVSSDIARVDTTYEPCRHEIGRKILNDHLERSEVAARIERTGDSYRVIFNQPQIQPSISLIIPTRNGIDHLRSCISSILDKTDYPSYRILIIDNGSDDAKTLDYLRSVQAHEFIQVVRDDRPFNYSALNNYAVSLTTGDIVGLVNDDIEVINRHWLSEMVSYAVRPDIGAVGAKLLYADNTIQHAGIVLGIHGIAGHVHRFLPRDSAGYFGRARSVRAVSAVTGACLLVRREVYEQVGGLNETELQIGCNDVDFCLRIREAGYINIWTPFAELYHHESVSRGFDITPEKIRRSESEIEYMKRRWGSVLQRDPAYNLNLGLYDEHSRIAWPPRTS
ncbi:glycosyltransferase family 2 protein [Paraburkholderia sp. MM5477-R1]|uniref:glycosyltransferase family 2 protein n=1 Tax=Paraburkholderia sp. MM5477-R1 TaxID=2991062 RepID=UPI003D246034